MASTRPHCDLSVIIPADGSVARLALLLPKIHSALAPLTPVYEIIVSAWSVDEKTRQVVQGNHARLVPPLTDGYGAALIAGFQNATGDYLVVMDTDHDHPADLLHALWSARNSAEVVIASRYAPGGRAEMPPLRKLLSKILNAVFGRGLDLHVLDMSSGYRLYKAHVIYGMKVEGRNYDILQETLVRALMAGYRIREVPFEYHSSDNQITRVTQFGLAYLGTFARLWRLRNSIASADYDSRAYDALMPPQRYWQRQRYKHITQLMTGRGRCLDVGCGSSRIIGALPPDSIALDILIRKLRFSRRFGHPTVQGSIFDLPVPGASFPCVICSQVIEHVPRANALDELDRVLKPGGTLILGTPDYARWQWVVIEWLYKILLPQAYADEHITHYTYRELVGEFVDKRGYQLEDVRYILQGELILGLRKPLA